MSADLQFGREPAATPGPLTLRFGDDSGRVVLVFDRRQVETPGPVRLVLGEAAVLAPPVRVDAFAVLPLPGLGLSARVVAPNDALAVLPLPGLGLAATGAYLTNVSRPTVGQAKTTHRLAQALGGGSGIKHALGGAAPQLVEAPHGLAWPQPAGAEAKHQAAAPRSGDGRARHTEADALRLPVRLTHEEALRGRRLARAASHEEAVARRSQASSAHQDRIRAPRPAWTALNAEAKPLRRTWESGAGVGARRLLPRLARHQEAMKPPAGRSVFGVVVPPFDPCYLPDPNLLFAELAPASTRLVFICERHAEPPGPGATLVIPVRRAYFVTNVLSLRRASDNTPIPATSLSVSLDADSWTWGFNASVPGDALGLLTPSGGVPVGLIATVNGMEFFVLAESLSRNRSFGRSDLSVRGRGRNAVLAAPYAPTRTFLNDLGALTAQQLAADALTDNGVPLGWGLTWGLDDWLVPSGAWVHQGTPIDALLAIAGAAGGYLQPHPMTETLIVRHRYPELPRDWPSLTPDVELPSAVVSVEGIEWLDKPEYNRVFVQGGQIGGQLGQVTLAGTAGDLVAPMVVDPLLTDLPALRQRGRAILGDTGRQARMTLRVPALTELGLVEPGKLVRYVDGATTHLGLVRSVQIEASHAAAWQTLGVETHV